MSGASMGLDMGAPMKGSAPGSMGVDERASTRDIYTHMR